MDTESDEDWKSIPNYNKYLISNKGRVKIIYDDKIMIPFTDKDNDAVVFLINREKSSFHKILPIVKKVFEDKDKKDKQE